ncbi:MAG: flagellar basal body rod protein FlgB [Armatimonadota bacterium]|nr:MAG: flagellar basal body rod protein FlgB [Armatimonadota bacterium]
MLSDATSRALAAALEGAAARQGAIAHNLANVDTPGFTRTDVEFEEALALALEGARRAPHRAADFIAALSLRPRPDRLAPARADGNNVDIDREMVLLSRNALRYQAVTEALAGRIRALRNVIQEGRR